MSNIKEKMSWKRVINQSTKAFKVLYAWYPKLVVLVLLAAVLKAIVPYIGIWFSAQILTELTGAADSQKLLTLVLETLGITAFAALVSGLISRFKDAEVRTSYQKTNIGYSEKMLSMDFARVDETATGELLSTIKQNSNASGWGLYKILVCLESMMSGLATVIGGIGLTISLFTSRVTADGYLATLNQPYFVLAIIGLMFFSAYFSAKMLSKEGQFWAEHINDHAQGNRVFFFFMSEAMDRNNAVDIRMYEQDKIMGDAIVREGMGSFGTKGLFAQFARRRGGMQKIGGTFISMLFTGFIYLFVCLKAWGGAFGIGAVTQYIAAITALSGGVAVLMSQVGAIRNNTAFVDLALEFLDIPNDMYKGSLSVEKRMDGNYEVEFRDVSFKYPGSDNWSLRHVSVKFNVGSRLAVVGENGSGKTTFIKLLCRLYDPTEGQILLNGIPIDEYDYDEYMDIFSVVFQDFMLYALPLGENVAASTQYDPAQVTECLDKAGFSERLADMPEGLNTYLYKEFNSDGVDISGGEAQKIALARALYKGSPFIILDEPTAALDPIAEADIYTRFNEIVGGHTTIYISHRLSSCKFCDRIVVFDHGSIVQYGSHNSLVAEEGGKYQALWNAQAQYYQNTGDANEERE